MTQKWEENIPKFYFCIRAPTFSTPIPWLFIIKICFTNKANTICGGGQLLVSRSQGPISRVSGVRVPYPSVVTANFRGPRSRVPGSQVLGPRCPWSRVSGPDFRLCHMLMYRWVKILFLGIFSPVDRSFNIYQISAVFAKETN